MRGRGAGLTPREEEPQIVVPLADVFVRMPGATAEEVEQQVSSKLERLLYQIDGVEYVYSMSRPGRGGRTVRFYVGENREDSLVKLHNKIMMNTDVVPPGVTGWVVKPIEIDDVPLVNVTLWSKTGDDFALRRVAEQVEVALQGVPEHGPDGSGRRPAAADPRARSTPSGWRLGRSRRWTWTACFAGRTSTSRPASCEPNNREVHRRERAVRADARRSWRRSWSASSTGRPVYLREVATVTDGPEEPANYTRISFGPGGESTGPRAQADFPAVTVGVAKRKGSNAVSVAHAHRGESSTNCAATVIPDDIEVRITRNYGETADEKVNELVRELGLAIVIVSGLIMFTLGWREAIIVVTAVPLTFALTLLVNYLAGYSINRVTLFALILALGLVVDDPIVDVENIFRHFGLRKKPPREAVLKPSTKSGRRSSSRRSW